MNHDNDPIPCFDDRAEEREWLAQERAKRRERLHPDAAGDDARSQRYRLLARSLRQASPDGLPADFAEHMASIVSTSAQARVPAMTLERTLTNVLAGVLVLVASAVIVIYGVEWLPSFKLLLPTPATAQWLLALLGCVGLNGILGAWSRRILPPA